MPGPRFASALHSGGALDDALESVGDRLARGLDGGRPDLVVLFVSPAFGAGVETAGERLAARLGAGSLIGCTGGGVLEASAEVEGAPALSAFAAVLPGARVRTVEVRHDELLTGSDPRLLRRALGGRSGEQPFLLTLCDPFTLDADLLLARLAEAFPGAPAVGGLASGGGSPGQHVLFRDGSASRFGGVVLAVEGLPVRCLVSQGCRPVGRRFVITRADENKVLALSGRPALGAIQEVVGSLPDGDRELARTNLLFGRVTREAQAEFGQGDFLVRNLMGVLPDEEAVVVGDRVRVGQTVQLQLRDRTTATEDLDLALSREIALHGRPAAALLFTCAGRGRRLFGAPDHDVRALREHAGDLPLAGFFCSGEIGPVGGANFVHGFSASLALF